MTKYKFPMSKSQYQIWHLSFGFVWKLEIWILKFFNDYV